MRKERTWGEIETWVRIEGKIGKGGIRMKDQGRGWMSVVRGIEEKGRGREECWTSKSGGEGRCRC